MLVVRLSKVILSFILSLFALLAMVNNLSDYGVNYALVEHVLRMDTIFPHSVLRYRAITAESIWRLSYALIIVAEGFTGLFFMMGAYTLWRRRYASATQFHRAKKWIYVGAISGVLIWLLGFMVVGGEWFAMWQSKSWTGQEPAFRIYITMLAVLIYVNQADLELE